MTSAKIFRAHAGFLAGLDLMIEQASDPVLCEASAPVISKWSVKDHLEHLSIANGSTVKWLERVRDGDPELDTGGRPNMIGRIVLLFGTFPRGRGKAPEGTRPQGTSAAELAERLRRTRERVEGLEGSLAQLQASPATRNHFVFGDLNATQWLQFAALHTKHHQKIIRDVVGATSFRRPRDWDVDYKLGELPWDTGVPDPHLVEFVERHGPASGKALEVGCGTGTNCLWLAEHGFEALGIDIAPTAIEQAQAKAAGASHVRFACLDFLKDTVPDGPFGLVFDRGCFHVFDEADDRALFAERVAQALAPDGVWVSMIGSTEGPPRDHGPPRRSARDITDAIEPMLEVVELRSTEFHGNIESPAMAWFCVARPRLHPAQPSTRR